MSKYKKVVLAIDIGASGGRHIISYHLNHERVMDEVYRFENYMDLIEEGYTWNINRLWDEIKRGIRIASEKYPQIDSIGIDTWGVDYVLLKGETTIKPVYAYRNVRTEKSINLVHERIPFDHLYQITGCQFQPFNTIYQLYHDKLTGRLDQASDFLMLPEYFFYRLTGIKVKEYTNATTTGLVDLKTEEYSQEIIARLGLRKALFGPLTKPKYSLPLKDELKKEFGTDARVVLIATHDTASAIEGIDVKHNQLYLSSGTWSLLGVKVHTPLLTPKAQQLNFTHEGGVGYLRFQKNIMGLWILQNLKKEFSYDSYEDMVRDAKASRYTTLFNVDDEAFLAPLSMRDAVLNYLKNHEQPLPKDQGDYIQSFFLSLAHSYKRTIEEIEGITERTYSTLTIFGGGAKNGYLNQIIEEITGKKVIAHPIEATAIGNMKLQEDLL